MLTLLYLMVSVKVTLQTDRDLGTDQGQFLPKTLLSSDFIVAFIVVVQFILSFSHPSCQALQKTVISSRHIIMQSIARQQSLLSEMKASLVNYGERLKSLLQKLTLNCKNREQLAIACIEAMLQRTQLMPNVITGWMFTTLLLTTVLWSVWSDSLVHLSLCSLATNCSQAQYPQLHQTK